MHSYNITRQRSWYEQTWCWIMILFVCCFTNVHMHVCTFCLMQLCLQSHQGLRITVLQTAMCWSVSPLKCAWVAFRILCIFLMSTENLFKLSQFCISQWKSDSLWVPGIFLVQTFWNEYGQLHFELWLRPRGLLGVAEKQKILWK